MILGVLSFIFFLTMVSGRAQLRSWWIHVPEKECENVGGRK